MGYDYPAVVGGLECLLERHGRQLINTLLQFACGPMHVPMNLVFGTR